MEFPVVTPHAFRRTTIEAYALNSMPPTSQIDQVEK